MTAQSTIRFTAAKSGLGLGRRPDPRSLPISHPSAIFFWNRISRSQYRLRILRSGGESRFFTSRNFNCRRDKPAHPATVAPAGSNRSGDGGNEVTEAFGVEGRLGDLASMQAVT